MELNGNIRKMETRGLSAESAEKPGFFDRFFGGDRVLWVIIAILSVASLLVIFSSTASMAYRKAGGDTSHYFFAQLKFIVLGFAAMIAVHRLNYQRYARPRLLALVFVAALLFMLLAGIIGGLIAGPELSAMADTVLRSLRDEPGYWWETYRRVWKRNARESLVPGMLTGLVLSMQIFTLFHMSVISAGIVTWVLLILSFVVTLGLESYIWPQIALLDLPLYGILKNSLLLFLGYLPRSLGAIAIKAVYWGAILLFFPLTTIILPFTNFWLPMLPALLCVYQPLNKCFTIESTINKMREDELNAALAKDNEPLPEDPTEKAEESTEASSDDSSSDDVQ